MGAAPVPISVSRTHFALRYEVPKFLARGGHLCMAVLTIATVQRMSANFQNKAVSKYVWNMYQLMSAAVHVLRYVLSSGYQMRALHEFTNVSGS